MAAPPVQAGDGSNDFWVFQQHALSSFDAGSLPIRFALEGLGDSSPLQPDRPVPPVQPTLPDQSDQSDFTVHTVNPDSAFPMAGFFSSPDNTSVTMSDNTSMPVSTGLPVCTSVPINTNVRALTTGTPLNTPASTSASASTSTSTSTPTPTTTSTSSFVWTDPAVCIDMKTSAFRGAFTPDSCFKDAQRINRPDSALWIDESRSTPAPLAYALPVVPQMTALNVGGAAITAPSLQSWYNPLLPMGHVVDNVSPTTSSSSRVTETSGMPPAGPTQLHASPDSSTGSAADAAITTTTAFTSSDVAMYGLLFGHADLTAYLPAAHDGIALSAAVPNMPFAGVSDANVFSEAAWNVPFSNTPATDVFSTITQQPSVDANMAFSNLPTTGASSHATMLTPRTMVASAEQSGKAGNAPAPVVGTNSDLLWHNSFLEHPSFLNARAQWITTAPDGGAMDISWLPAPQAMPQTMPVPPFSAVNAGPEHTPEAPQQQIFTAVSVDPKPSTISPASRFSKTRRPSGCRVSRCDQASQPASVTSPLSDVPHLPAPPLPLHPFPTTLSPAPSGIAQSLSSVSAHTQATATVSAATPVSANFFPRENQGKVAPSNKHARAADVEDNTEASASPSQRLKQKPPSQARFQPRQQKLKSPQQNQSQSQSQNKIKIKKYTGEAPSKLSYDRDASGQYDARIPRFPTGPGQVSPSINEPCVMVTSAGEVIIPFFTAYTAESIIDSDTSVSRFAPGTAGLPVSDGPPSNTWESQMVRVAAAQKKTVAIAKLKAQAKAQTKVQAQAKADGKGKGKAQNTKKVQKSETPGTEKDTEAKPVTSSLFASPSSPQTHVPNPYVRSGMTPSLRYRTVPPLSTEELNFGPSVSLPVSKPQSQTARQSIPSPATNVSSRANSARSTAGVQATAQSFPRPVSRVPLPASAYTARPHQSLGRRTRARALTMTTRSTTAHKLSRGEASAGSDA